MRLTGAAGLYIDYRLEERRDQELKGILGWLLNGPFRQMGTFVEAADPPPGTLGL